MIPQGSAVLNTAYFTALEAQINGATTCAQLQALATQAITSILGFQAGITAQLALLEPMQALLTAPTNPTAAVTWIENFISTYLTPALASYVNYITKAAALTAQIATIIAAIETKAATFLECSITIPT